MTFERLDLCDGPACPNCGCQDAEILAEPKGPAEKSWFGAGKARCRHCGQTFHFKEVADDAQQPPVDYQEPVVEHQEPVVDVPSVAYQTVRKPLCPECGSGKVVVVATRRLIRRYKCKECGGRFKQAREPVQ